MAEPAASSGQAFARELSEAEERLRALGLSGRAAFNALARHLAGRLRVPEHLWPEGPDAPPAAALERIPLTAELDLFGLAYERFFPDLFKARRGQYFTPRPLVELVTELAGVGPRDRVLDPTCGSGGFLLAAMDRGADVDGIEIDPDLVTLARLNLALHGGTPRAARRGDVFAGTGDERWSVILANPPFSVPIRDRETLDRYDLGRGQGSAASDRLFLEAAWRALAPGGRLCAVLPHSIIANPSNEDLRAWVDERFVRRAVVELPEGIFRPFGGTATRACALLLCKRPAELGPQLVARVERPGYDTRRSRYRQTEPDELASLRLFLRGEPWSGATWVDPGGSWVPGDHLWETGVAPEVATVALGELARVVVKRLTPSSAPDERFCEIDLADLDKSTGEVAGARDRAGGEFPAGQSKIAFREGDLLFGRMRPYLNNVGAASRPREGLPERLVGSGEWVPLRAAEQPWFALTALRSPFTRAQLQTTGGQTRPRARVADLPAIQVPDPGPALRAELDRQVGAIHRERLALRRRLARIEDLYAAFGRGEIDAAALAESLEALAQEADQ